MESKKFIVWPNLLCGVTNHSNEIVIETYSMKVIPKYVVIATINERQTNDSIAMIVDVLI